MDNRSVHITAFTLRQAWENTPLTLMGLDFPLDWYGPICRLQGELENRAYQPNTPQVRSLNGVLTALVPHLMALPRQAPALPEPGASPTSPEPWLLANAAVAPAKIWLAVQAWLEQVYGECASYAEVQRALQPGDLQWRSISATFERLTEDNGTAKIPGLAYTALPALVAEMLVTRGTQIPVGAEIRGLMRTPTRDGASLVSWPPVFIPDKKGQKWGYSYVIDITLQTLIGCERPRLHFHYGVRRWASRPDLWIGKTARSVYLHSSRKWLGLDVAPSFTIARLKNHRSAESWVPVWDDKVAEIAARLKVQFPTAEELVADPQRWLKGDGGVVAGVVEMNSTFHHEVQPGVDLKIHHQLTSAISEVLAQELEPCSPLQKPSRFLNRKHPLTNHLREMPPNLRLDGLRESVGKSVRIEVFWQTAATRDMLVDRLLALLQSDRPELEDVPSDEGGSKKSRKRASEPSPSPAPECMEVDLEKGGRLVIVTREIGSLGAAFPLALEEETSKLSRREYIRRHSEERANAVVNLLGTAEQPTLALVELPDFSESRDLKWRDPKNALRLGMARAGRVSKFTTGEQAELSQRCEGTVRDGLRQLGYLPVPIGISSKQSPIPENMVVVGLWLIRLNQLRSRYRVFLPVAVVMHTKAEEVRAWIPDGKGIRPYHTALRDIAALDPQAVSRNRQAEMLRQVQQLIEHDIPAESSAPILVLASAQNMRALWKGLNNSRIAWDALRFGYNDAAVRLGRPGSEVRVIRLRTSERGETPEWYTDRSTPDSSPGSGYASGLWQDSEAPRLFYSIAPKSHMMAGKTASKQKDPGEYYAIPSPLEIVPVCLQPEDNPAFWAQAVHQWRGMGTLLTTETLRFPLPLAWASRMADYAEVIGNWEWADAEETDADDTE